MGADEILVEGKLVEHVLPDSRMTTTFQTIYSIFCIPGRLKIQAAFFMARKILRLRLKFNFAIHPDDKAQKIHRPTGDIPIFSL